MHASRQHQRPLGAVRMRPPSPGHRGKLAGTSGLSLGPVARAAPSSAAAEQQVVLQDRTAHAGPHSSRSVMFTWRSADARRPGDEAEVSPSGFCVSGHEPGRMQPGLDVRGIYQLEAVAHVCQGEERAPGAVASGEGSPRAKDSGGFREQPVLKLCAGHVVEHGETEDCVECGGAEG